LIGDLIDPDPDADKAEMVPFYGSIINDSFIFSLTDVLLKTNYIYLLFFMEGNTMASNSKKQKQIRKNKDRPNSANLKADAKRIAKNSQILRELAARD
jgi:hypothetical protein